MYYNESEEMKTRSREEKRGMQVHGVVTIMVCLLLLAINLTFTQQFLWFVFPWFGMMLGLGFHYVGYRKLRAR